jgi:hypothetical protein
LPTYADGWKSIACNSGTKCNFNNCIGAIDGKHVTIREPMNSISLYHNNKGTFSVVLMALVNANYEFLTIDVGTNGRISDGGVVKNTLFWKLLERNKLKIPGPNTMPGTTEKYLYVFVGDEALQLNEHFMRP